MPASGSRTAYSKGGPDQPLSWRSPGQRGVESASACHRFTGWGVSGLRTMSRSIALGVLLFAAGVVVGRFSAVWTQPGDAPVAAPAPAEVKPGGVLRGRVAEVLQVPQYTYLRLESGHWAAVPSSPSLQVGAQVSVLLQNEMTDFASPSLGRTFASVWFGALEGAAPVERAPEAAPPPAPEMKAVLQAVASSNAPTLRVVDVYSERAALAGRRVKVKGTVDRVNFVQGVHYVHLKDGTGSAAEKTDDLLCISAVDLPQGTAVTLEGVVAVDKNVGMGINPVVLEDAQAR